MANSSMHPGEDIPSFEPWVIVLFSVFVPIALGFIFPGIMWICFGTAVLIFATSMVMLAKQERARSNRTPPSPAKG